MSAAETFTEQSRRLLQKDASAEFTISRTGLETLVADSERYAALNERLSAAVPIAQTLRRDGFRITGESHVIAETARRTWALVDVILHDR